MTQYMPTGVRVRVIAWRDEQGQVGLSGMVGSVSVSGLVRSMDGEMTVVEQTTGIAQSKFFLLDLNNVQFTSDGLAVPAIVGEVFGDEDSAVMALRMVK